jgi:hypothetical protein
VRRGEGEGEEEGRRRERKRNYWIPVAGNLYWIPVAREEEGMSHPMRGVGEEN